jgi:hypothetical protein
MTLIAQFLSPDFMCTFGSSDKPEILLNFCNEILVFEQNKFHYNKSEKQNKKI